MNPLMHHYYSDIWKPRICKKSERNWFKAVKSHPGADPAYAHQLAVIGNLEST